MGAYLTSPKTDKISEDDESPRLKYGACSMQGWRISQEDAHNAILQYGDAEMNSSFFAVYDGHGGSEVAEYCSMKLPPFILKSKEIADKNYSKGLEQSFIDFDATLIERDVVAELKKLMKSPNEAEEGNEEDGADPNEIDNLCQEATMPIEDVIAKYEKDEEEQKTKEEGSGDDSGSSTMINKVLGRLKSSGASGSGTKNPSPFLRAKNSSKIDVEADSNSNNKHIRFDENGEETKTETKKEEENGEHDSSPSSEKENLAVNGCNGNGTSETKEELNGSKDEVKEDVTPATTDFKGKGKGKGKGKSSKIPPKPVNPEDIQEESPPPPPPPKRKPKKTADEIYAKLLEDEDEDSEDDDEDDQTFGGGPKDSSDDDDDDDEPEEEDDDEEEEEDSEDEEMEDDDENEFVGGESFNEEPGNDSGCTAVVGLIVGNELYVANAGDSRCVVCRNGEAIEMSFDHKPEDKPEQDRIEKAGGQVTPDGRVNGGLNLSRALGDHAYKTNKDLPLIEQMISPQPDIRTLRIDPKTDAFIVLACDGIWNSMTSQEVVDFVNPRLEKNPDKISSICEELFDACISPDTMGDGTGCDNMTAIIVKIKEDFIVKEDNSNKRTAEEESEGAEDKVVQEQPANKKTKLDEKEETTSESKS